MKNNTERTAFFPGSFNPFTQGHADIVDRALQQFDKIVIGIGCNIDKPALQLEERKEYIAQRYANEPRVEVIIFHNLAVEAAKAINASCIIRGIRGLNDFEYEKNMADVNMHLAKIDTLVFFTRPELAFMSSSIIRELNKYGKSLDNLL